MASIGNDRDGTRRVLFVAPDGKRHTIRLGKCNKRDAETFKMHVECLVSAKMQGCEPRREESLWLSDLPETMHQRLVRVGLARPRMRDNNVLLKDWMRQYIESRTDLKRSTVATLERAEKAANKFFPKHTRLAAVTVADAQDFRIFCETELKWAQNTVRRTIARMRQFFYAAMHSGIITKNPFVDKSLPTVLRETRERFYFLTQGDALKVLEACPDSEWRTIFALCRWGGLRCPSEVLRLEWQDIDFKKEQFTIHAPKTERHENGGIRVSPLWPEIATVLRELKAEKGDAPGPVITRYRHSGQNLRTTFAKIVRRAGLEPWPKPFQNLRSTRETELFKITKGDIKGVSEWIGNSPIVAMKHYAQVRDEDFTEALEAAKKVAQNPAQLGAELAQNPAQQETATTRKTPQAYAVIPSPSIDSAKECNALQGIAKTAKSRMVGATGLEPVTSTV